MKKKRTQRKRTKKLWRKILGYQVGDKVRIKLLPEMVWTITEVSMTTDGIRLYTIETEDGDLLYVSDRDILEE